MATFKTERCDDVFTPFYGTFLFEKLVTHVQKPNLFSQSQRDFNLHLYL